MTTRKLSRTSMTLVVAILLLAILSFAFWPKPLIVDLGQVTTAPMIVTINEEAKTRVHDAYVVSAPVAGRVLRVAVEPGDPVIGGETVIAQMLPLNPSALDVRTREQARATVSAAEAALRVAKADLNKAVADNDLAKLDLSRAETLIKNKTISQADYDRRKQLWKQSQAAYDTAKAAIAMREADLENARAQLISFSETPYPHNKNTPPQNEAIPLLAPTSGNILRVIQKSETTLAAGTPILEIGDISNDLEIVAELLSTDAVKVSAGNRVIIEKWGQEEALEGIVERVEPWGFTKFSALGVEEQRVNTIIQFKTPIEKRKNLGHGFRVETRIVIWENKQALTIPTSALFRMDNQWAVYVAINNQAELRSIKIGQNNGVNAEVLSGLTEGEIIVLYPSPSLSDGKRITKRETI